MLSFRNARRWGATLLTLVFLIAALAACGSDDGGNNGQTDTGVSTDTGSDTTTDTADDTTVSDTGGDTIADSGSDTGTDTTDSGTDTGDTMTSDTGDAGDGGQQGTIEIVGTYDNQFDSTETITADGWNATDLVDWSNDDNWAITQNPPDDQFEPDKFAKRVWTEPDADGVFYYCIVDFGLETEEAARTTDATADDSNPEEGGCGDFPWTKMTPTGGS